jgi:hypothetical protein
VFGGALVIADDSLITHNHRSIFMAATPKNRLVLPA